MTIASYEHGWIKKLQASKQELTMIVPAGSVLYIIQGLLKKKQSGRGVGNESVILYLFRSPFREDLS